MRLIRFNNEDLKSFGLNPLDWEVIPLENTEKALVKNWIDPELELLAELEASKETLKIKNLEWLL